MTLRFILISVTLVVGSAISDVSRTADYEKYQETKPIIADNKVIGVASVAGIMSRNGRVSSLGHIKIIPGKPITFTEDELYDPLTLSAQKDGKYTLGTVQVYPGHASARAGYAPYRNEALFNYLFVKPDIFTSMNLEPWFSRNLFTNSAPLESDTFKKNSWSYPIFNPFVNYWR